MANQKDKEATEELTRLMNERDELLREIEKYQRAIDEYEKDLAIIDEMYRRLLEEATNCEG